LEEQEANVNAKSVAAMLLCVLSTPAIAQDMKALPLAPSSALLANDRQAATIEKFGQVTIQEIALARRIAASDSQVSAVRQHAELFDFYLIPIKFGVLGFDGKTCRWMQFGATLKAAGADNSQVFILDVFPASSLKKGSLDAQGKVKVSSDLKIGTPDTGPATGKLEVGGSTEVNWKWSPLYQQAAAVFDQSRVIWRFDAVGSEFPVGETEVGVILAVSKSAHPKIGFDMELRASFGGGWFDRDGIARADATLLVRLP
jgi:hypothetical protein